MVPAAVVPELEAAFGFELILVSQRLSLLRFFVFELVARWSASHLSEAT